MRVTIALEEPHRTRLEKEFAAIDWQVVPWSAAGEASDAEAIPDLLLVTARHDTLTADLIAHCDAAGVRVVAVGDSDIAHRLAGAYGLSAPVPASASANRVREMIAAPLPTQGASLPRGGRVITVWGPGGAPGRTTLAIELAHRLASRQDPALLVDADTHGAGVALALGLGDEGPGFPAACRRAQRQELDATELARISQDLGGGLRVLTGINRPSRWPELPQDRVRAALTACRGWSSHTVVDVAAPLERDEEIVSDLVGDRRNGATLGALLAADLVIAVAGADPVGVARFLRAHAQLRETIGVTPTIVIANRLRPGALGIDARGQVRRSLARFAGIGDVWFVPPDPRSADAALLAGKPIGAVAPRSPIVTALDRLVADTISAPDHGRHEPAHRRRRIVVTASPS
ncbi:hypothetical protein GCM10009808_03030 [Microbacterium sediminicola]|uniref:CobQ/CobB/MinD/ParA nucleotide binding domain-containing protein n=1 Tax=Microbacterium sediminicola TaxID=415210 RepID=A0ABP4TLH0_9MICO